MGMEHILNEPEGSQITVFEVLLYNQWKHKNNGREDVLFITYKDEKEQKKVKAIRSPEMEIYFTDPKYRKGFNTPREYIEMEKVYSRKVPARKVVPTIYEEMKNETDPVSMNLKNIYRQAIQTNNRSATKEIFKWPYTQMSDMTVEDYYRVMLGYHYDTTSHGHIINKAYLDIESQVYGLTSTEQAENLDPTNACTLIFTYDDNARVKKKPQVFTFLLRNHELYPQQKSFEANLDKFVKQCHDEFDKQVVKKKNKERVFDMTSDYHIKLFDSEADLLVAIFETINAFKPDTCSVWNIGYDIPKLAARMTRNGLNYVDVMSDKAFPKDYRLVELNVDNRAAIDIADRKTFMRMASTTKYVDQMQSYAGIRKGRKSYGSNKLDNISNIELGMGKREFASGIDVTNAPIKDYWNFVLYNITDVWRQVLIDIVTNDCMSMVYDSNQQNCSLENLTKQTRYQKQIYYTWYLRKGFVPGNNPNVNYIKGESEEYLEYLEELRQNKKRRMYGDNQSETMDANDLEDDDSDDDDNDELETLEDDSDDENLNETAQLVAEKLTANVYNIFKDTIDRTLTLPGGLVGDPDNNTASGTELISGVKSKHVFDDVMDMDFASEYPWAKYTRSMSKSTQIGRLIIGDKISPRQNTLPLGMEKRTADIKSYLPGAEFTADYISHDVISMGNVWFNLPDTTEMSSIIGEKLKGVL